MPTLPKLSGRAVVKTFGREGWELVRQKGSHMILVKEGSWASLSVPDHREIAQGTLRCLIRAAGMTAEEFIALARK
jgi:predicted RNA binding protein YcfA (HicA-like mRNA interferase family)